MAVPFGVITKVEKGTGSNLELKLEFATPMCITLQFDRSSSNYQTIIQFLENELRPLKSLSKQSVPVLYKTEVKESGWQVYNPIKEFQRMGIQSNFSKKQITSHSSQFQVERCSRHFPDLQQNFDMGLISQNPLIYNSLENKEQPPRLLSKAVYHAFSLQQQSQFLLQPFNYTYKLCPTYPAFLAFPDFLCLGHILRCGEYRSEKRIPTVTWKRLNGPCIARCSQPLQGIRGGEAILFDALLVNGICSQQFPRSIIFDARPSLTIKAQQLLGKGGEKIEEYETVERVVMLGMDGIAMREQYESLKQALIEFQKQNVLIQSGYELFYDPKSNWIQSDEEVLELNPGLVNTFSINELKSQTLTPIQEHKKTEDAKKLVDNSDQITPRVQNKAPLQLIPPITFSKQRTAWLEHLEIMLQGALLISVCINKRRNAIIHCSDGWDRTPMLCALAQILLDPYYRTTRGFCTLVAKDFVSFGHRFGSRLGNFAYQQDDSQKSPVFIMFLEGVFNILEQNKTLFEFDGALLEHLAFCSYNRFTGTFLFDCEADSNLNKVAYLTNSAFDDPDQWTVRQQEFGEPQLNLERITLWWKWWGRHI